jgi:hypothetical protein
MTPEECLQDYQTKMGIELGFIYHNLEQTHIWNKKVFCQHKALYSTSKSRVDLMNRCAPEFFHMLSYVFFDSMVLGTVKLFDPASQNNGKYQNISFHTLAELVNDERKRFISDQISTIIEQIESLKARRHKQIAHFDKLVHETLDYVKVDLKMISDIHLVIEQILNKIKVDYTNTTMLFKSLEKNQAYTILLYHLQNSLRYENHLFDLEYKGEEIDRHPNDEISKKYKI